MSSPKYIFCTFNRKPSAHFVEEPVELVLAARWHLHNAAVGFRQLNYKKVSDNPSGFLLVLIITFEFRITLKMIGRWVSETTVKLT